VARIVAGTLAMNYAESDALSQPPEPDDES